MPKFPQQHMAEGSGLVFCFKRTKQDLTPCPYSNKMKWVARSCAPIASVVLPAGFFGLAFLADFKVVVYVGIILLATSMLLTGVGLLRSSQSRGA